VHPIPPWLDEGAPPQRVVVFFFNPNIHRIHRRSTISGSRRTSASAHNRSLSSWSATAIPRRGTRGYVIATANATSCREDAAQVAGSLPSRSTLPKPGVLVPGLADG
jgi:hypothetical protein